ncbi:DUF4231 domain-containing protein [Leptolyngbya cf. ectocarpi LEGE 11479]|uniref:DUF4231 domain-containing protein n=1 Tax=Leptolyngbya cf. ectocarpi LEGE 11479 TaxID=1828722 RepID=A0A928ZXR7_LEPEC|nr:DUF4231 domain-containing protein [Leptolyngbya ectocarpi]MBE9069360.1 DUF4231 domain-containing protein [Leptolyngbya cf. ectocarpi LEGE 11479]
MTSKTPDSFKIRLNPADLTSGIDSKSVPLTFRLIEFLLLSICIVLVAFLVLSLGHRETVIYALAIVSILLLVLVFNRQVLKDYRKSSQKQENEKKAGLYSIVLEDSASDKSMNLMRQRALQYCQDLINDYKETRRTSRSIYYVFQISTIILSGVTPILVLLDKVEVQSNWVKWLPVIFPAIASIVTSISTSFPFQENSVAANTAVELLEAEQERFILGVTPAYRFFDIEDEAKRKRKIQESVESFVNQVNQIHLKQIAAATQPEPSKANEKGTPALV